MNIVWNNRLMQSLPNNIQRKPKIIPRKDLRENPILAAQVGFKDDPKLKDTDTLTMTKAVGGSVCREIFSIWFQHRELMRELLNSKEDEFTDEQGEKFLGMAKMIDNEVEQFLKKHKPVPAPAKPKPQN